MLNGKYNLRSLGFRSSASAFRPAFTIVELLIVIVFIAILATITIIAYNGITRQANQSAALSSSQNAAKKLVLESIQHTDILPSNLASIGITNTDNITYQYTKDDATNSYCITATSKDSSANTGGFAGSVNPSTLGPCAGHTGTSPTTLDDGSTCPTNYIVVPGNSKFNTKAFCLMKYEAKIAGNDSGQDAGYDASWTPDSRATGTPWTKISQLQAIDASKKACDTCHLMTEAEWMTVAANVLSVPSNWSNNAVGDGYIYSGHNDDSPSSPLEASTNDSDGYAGTGNVSGSNQRRTLTLTNGEVIWDLAGNVYEWTDATITGNQPGLPGESSFTWKQYDNSSLAWNGLSTSSQPSATGLGGSITWNSSQGVGRLYSNSGDGASRAFRRGGHWYNGGGAGVLALGLNNAPSSTNTNIGFRVAGGI